MRSWLLVWALFAPPEDEIPVQRPDALGPDPGEAVTPEPTPAPTPAVEPPAEPADPPGDPAIDRLPAETPSSATDPDAAPVPAGEEVPAGPRPPSGKGTGLLITAGGVATGALVGRVLFGLVFLEQINRSTPDRAPRLYLTGALVSLPAGAALGLAAAARALKARHDLYQDLHVFRTGPKSKRGHIAAGWTLFGAGIAGWVATRAASPTVADQCPRGECFVLYMEATWYGSALLSTTGLMLAAYGTHYTRLAKRGWTGELAAAPLWGADLRGVALGGRF